MVSALGTISFSKLEFSSLGWLILKTKFVNALFVLGRPFGMGASSVGARWVGIDGRIPSAINKVHTSIYRPGPGITMPP